MQTMKNLMKRRLFLSLFFVPTASFAHSYKQGAIAIGHAWALVSSGTETVAMMPLYNTADTQDSLIGVSCDAATSVELRDVEITVAEFVLLPRKPFPMRATAKHLQLIGLKRPLVKGDRVSMTLKFRNAGEITLELHINETAGE